MSVLILAGCASVKTRLPRPAPAAVQKETRLQTREGFARLLRQQRRLDRVSARILQANAKLCKKTRPDFGLRTHSLKSYPKPLRTAAAHELSALEYPSVLLVRSGGPAAVAGLRPGDVLLNPEGKPVSALDRSLAGAKTLRIRRGDREMKIAIKGIPACAYPVRLKTSSAINAWADGKHITVTTAMMDFVKDDRELALVLGHELAHNTMGHVRKAIWNALITGFATRYTRPFEAEADYVGLYYMARAGYDIEGVEQIWRRLGTLFPKNALRAKSHPVTPERLLAIRMTAKEIKARQKAGEALLPKPKA